MRTQHPFLPLMLALGLGLMACDPKTDDSAPVEGDADADADSDTDSDTGPVDQDGDGIPAWRDCDDTDPAVGGPATWYADRDEAGWGDDASPTTACEQPSGAVAQPGDCDDADPGVNPDATEICNGLDDDCDGLVDDEDDSLDLATRATFYEDADGDGWGLDASTTQACAAPDGWVEQGGDCDDGEAGTNPDAWDVIDGVDNDCDGTADVISLAAADVVLEGDSTDEFAGAAFAGQHDLDGDSYTDLLIGAVGADSTLWDVGEVYLVHGPITASMILSHADAILTGTEAYGCFGWFLEATTDLDGDSYGDIVVGTMGWGQGDARGHPAGAYYLFPGSVTGTASMSGARLCLESTLLEDNNLAVAGDTDGDGLEDLLVSSVDHGLVWVVPGADLGGSGTLDISDLAEPIAGEPGGDRYGYSVQGVGDIDADGLADIAVGAPMYDTEAGNSSGAVYVFPSGMGWPASAADAHIRIESAFHAEHLGWSMDGGTDIDGDDVPDLLLGAFNRAIDPVDGGGAVYYLSGALTDGVESNEYFDALMGTPGQLIGSDVGILGDIDSDGAIEFGTQAQADKYTGTPWPAFIVDEVPLGQVLTTASELDFQPPNYYSGIGWPSQGVGDMDGDGIDDICITDSVAGTSYVQPGEVYLFFRG
jgi:hypothetical protein